MSPRAILFLAGAVATELVAVTVMKLVADNDSLLSLLFMYVMIGLSFYLLSFVVLYVPMGLAYAMWEASGMTAVTIIGYLLFAETMNAYKLTWLALLISGVIIVKLATPEDSPVSAQAESSAVSGVCSTAESVVELTAESGGGSASDRSASAGVAGKGR